MFYATNTETLASPRMKPVEGEEVNQQFKVFQLIIISRRISSKIK